MRAIHSYILKSDLKTTLCVFIQPRRAYSQNKELATLIKLYCEYKIIRLIDRRTVLRRPTAKRLQINN